MMFFRVPAVLRRLLHYSDSGTGYIAVNQSKQVRFADDSNTICTYSTTSKPEAISHSANKYPNVAHQRGTARMTISGLSSTMYSESAPNSDALRRDTGAKVPASDRHRASRPSGVHYGNGHARGHGPQPVLGMYNGLEHSSGNGYNGGKSKQGHAPSYPGSNPAPANRLASSRKRSQAQREKRHDTFDRPYGFTAQPTMITLAPGVNTVRRHHKSYKGHYTELPDIGYNSESGRSESDSDSDGWYGGGHGAYGYDRNQRKASAHSRRKSHQPYPHGGRKTVRFEDSQGWGSNVLGLTGYTSFNEESDCLLKPRYGWN